MSFIYMYRERNVLWDTGDPQYKNKTHDWVMRIAASFGTETN